jgi:OOP family OmpA-OmpF porin
MKTTKTTTALFTFFLLTGCAHRVKPVAISSDTNSREVMEKLSAKLNTAYSASADILAPLNYDDGFEYYQEAKEEFEDKDFEKGEFLEDAGLSMAFLNKAIEDSDMRSSDYRSIVEARSSAIKEGARLWDGTKKKLSDIDKRTRVLIADSTREVELSEMKSIEKSYYDLKAKAIINRDLSYAMDTVKDAKAWEAGDRAPETLGSLESELASAKTIIMANSSSPEVYSPQVETALISALLMNDVMATIDRNGGDVEESVALNLVRKDRMLSSYEDRISGLKKTVDTAKTMISVMDNSLEQKNKLLTTQEKVEKLRAMFSSEEADVIRKGNDVLIRLKKVNFPVGQSMIPAKAKTFLKKVSKHVEDVRPESIVVLGHTDTTGPKEYNSYLSKQRAAKVAEFMKDHSELESIKIKGMSYKAPLTANVDKKTRAQNRRVDIVLRSIN